MGKQPTATAKPETDQPRALREAQEKLKSAQAQEQAAQALVADGLRISEGHDKLLFHRGQLVTSIETAEGVARTSREKLQETRERISRTLIGHSEYPALLDATATLVAQERAQVELETWLSAKHEELKALEGEVSAYKRKHGIAPG